jgi:hypothetical protein
MRTFDDYPVAHGRFSAKKNPARGRGWRGFATGGSPGLGLAEPSVDDQFDTPNTKTVRAWLPDVVNARI